MKTTNSVKIKFVLFIVCFCIRSSTFSQKIVSLNALYTEQNAILIPGVEGLWVIPGYNFASSINKAGDNFYSLKYGSEKNPSAFEATFVKIKDEIFLDLTGEIADTLGDADYRNSFLKTHTLYKVRIMKDTVQLSELNYSWFYNYAFKKHSLLKFEWVDNAMLLTFSTTELDSFLTEHSNEKEMFNVDATLISKHTNVVKPKIVKRYNFNAKTVSPVSQNFKPEFLFQNGWFGGDGDVSVPLNETTTLFFFSDSYVGNKNQKNRQEPGLKMVSNTVAIETWLPNGKTEIKYFWNKMYSERPEPFFKTFTKRYSFWVSDAFTSAGNLYVLLQKVGRKTGVSPDDFFPFSLPGFSIAKIINPLDLPNRWQIELIPVPDFVYPDMQLGAHATKDNYVYFFVSRHDSSQHLVRKRSDFLDDPGKPFEYYSLNKTWKAGIKKDDMDTIFNGFRSVTVNYHPSIKKWIMLIDIRFRDNKIKIRTATALEGPWSDEITVCECPEVTIGTASYSKSNFCYLPRECPQNYDVKKNEMLITYDINNSDFSEINSNPKIYTPKVIAVSLKKCVTH